MTTDLLRKVLHSYLNEHAPEAEDYRSLLTVLEDLNEIEQRAGTYDAFKHDCYVLHASAACDLMNEATYDDYGKIYANNYGTVTFDDYKASVLVFRDTLTDSMIQLGFDIVGDLYAQNEELGCHKPDGTFDKDAKPKAIQAYKANRNVSAINMLEEINKGNIPEGTADMLLQAESCKQLLTYCSLRPGADIEIKITHQDGQVAVAKLYDHAALVQSLYEALEYFQSEIM